MPALFTVGAGLGAEQIPPRDDALRIKGERRSTPTAKLEPRAAAVTVVMAIGLAVTMAIVVVATVLAVAVVVAAAVTAALIVAVTVTASVCTPNPCRNSLYEAGVTGNVHPGR